MLGVGAGATLAAWNDATVMSGSFASSVFDLESQSGDGLGYRDHLDGTSAGLAFEAIAMSPGVSHFAWLNIRTTPESTVGGEVRLTSSEGEGTLATALQYRVVRMPFASPVSSCDVSAFAPGAVFLAGGAAEWIAASSAPPPVSTTVGPSAASVGFCFDVRIAPGAPNALQGAGGSTRWTFTGISE